MDYNALWSEIQANSACAPFVHTNEMPKISGPEVAIKDQAIADILSAGRTQIVSKEVGDGAISLALGVPAGPVFLYQLEQIAASTPDQNAPPEQITRIAIARQAWRSLIKGGFDVGNPGVRAGLDLFVGDLLTQSEADAIKALAEVPEIITAADVSRAVRGPRD